MIDLLETPDAAPGDAQPGWAERSPGSEPTGPAASGAQTEFHQRLGTVHTLLNGLEDERWHPLQTRALANRAEAAATAADAWFRDGHPDAADLARRRLSELSELINRREQHVLEDSMLTIGYGDRVWKNLLFILAASLLAAVLMCVLGLSLMRRWVLLPVASLRRAAARIGSGDFEHRIPVTGHDEIAQLSAEVNQMAEMVHRMQEERVERERLAAAGELVRRLAHNLRNPLSGIRSVAEMTRAELAPGSELRDHQDRIILSIDRFERWLRDLLDATSPLRLNPAPCRLRPWLNGVVETHRAQADRKRVRLTVHTDHAPEEATIDARHIEHSVVALVSNAIEAAPAHSDVRIDLCAAGDGRCWDIRVTDHGPGVPADLLDRIFKPYFTTKSDGNGIGLAVAQQVARAHGGIVFVESGVEGRPNGTGATFVLRLPVDCSEPRGSDRPNTPREG